MSDDTTIALNNELFLKAPDDKLFGYLYRIETNHTTETFHKTDLYNGKEAIVLSVDNGTFFAAEGPHFPYLQSVIGELRSLKENYSRKPFVIKQLGDTLINGVPNSHITAIMRDTLDNNEHLFINRDYYLDKVSGLPGLITITARSRYNGAINNYYNETKYSNYKVDQPNISVANFEIPLNYRPRGEIPPAPSLLDTGIDAPDWTLFDTNGKKLSLTQLKGKVVLLDFYYIGCSGCMASIQPLNTIYEKYKNKGLVIASLSERDSKRAVLEFEKHYNISYAGYINALDVVKSYHVTSFPTFYFIDKAGKIKSTFVGYSDDFLQKATAIIDALLNDIQK